MTITDYRGMSYSTASREASRLIEEALESGKWHPLPEKLSSLRAIMIQHVERGTVNSRPPTHSDRPPVDMRKFVVHHSSPWMTA